MTAAHARRRAEQAVDIGALMRADILARDWGAVHVRAQEREPINLPDQRKWRWMR